jgi:putative ABC transport system permease protein
MKVDRLPAVRIILNDIRVALRIFSRRPGFSLAAVLTLAIGIGATATIFSFVNAVLIRPLPYPGSDRIVTLQTLSSPGPATTVSPGDFLDWQAQSASFEHMSAFANASVSLTGGGEPERLRSASVTSHWFETFGVSMTVGRSFLSYAKDVEPLDPAVISHALWVRRFASDRSIVGTPIVLNNRPVRVIGVAPAGFSFPEDLPLSELFRDPRPVDIWMPIALQAGDRGRYFLNVIARLERGVSIEASQSEMAAIAVRLGEQFAGNRGSGVLVAPLEERIVGDVRSLLFLLAGAGAFVLLIAAVNVANLLLARAAERQQEVAIRSALGSSRWRLIRLLVTESVMLSLAGGLLGLLMAAWGVDLVSAIIPPGSLPRMAEVVVDRMALAFAVTVSLLVATTFGAIPAVIATRKVMSPAVGKVTPSAAAASAVLKLFVVSEVALTFVLLTGAGLLVKSFARLTSVDPGFRADRVLTLSVALPEAGYETTAQMNAFAGRVLDRFSGVPDVLHAGVVNWLPIGGGWLAGDVIVERPARFPRGLNLTKTSVSGEYFSAMGIPLVTGRSFDERDSAGAAGVVIVTEDAARRIWPGESPIGKHVKLGFGRPQDQPWMTVIGTVGDVKQMALSESTQPAIYFPVAQTPRPALLREGLTFVVRTGANPRRAAAELTRRLRSVDANLPIDRVRTMDDLVGDSVSNPRFRGVVFASFATAALLLVTTGIIGVLAYSVARRTREIGVRMALGADRAKVLGLVVRQALTMTAIGLAAGAIAAAGLTRLLSSYLFEVTPRDPVMFAAAAAIMLLLAVVAAYLPARRAAGVDPLLALRQE